MYQLKLQFSDLPKIISNGAHGAWQAKAARVRKWKERVLASVGENRPDTPLLKARIVLTRHSSYEPDFDNLVISFKPLLDGLKGAGVIADDRRVNVGRPEYLWQYAPRNQGFVTIEVFQVTDDMVQAHG